MMGAGPASPEDDASRLADIAAPPDSPGAARRLLPVLAVAAAVVAADQGTKQWALSYLTHRRNIALPGNWVSLRLVTNPGAAFSVGSGSTWVFTLLATAVVLIVPWFAARARGQVMALGLLLGGAAGNLADRLFRAPGPGIGRVVDFIDYHGWFIGNVADIAIVVSGGLLMLRAVRSPGHKHQVPAQPPKACPGP
jgi:signal peptidase II